MNINVYCVKTPCESLLRDPRLRKAWRPEFRSWPKGRQKLLQGNLKFSLPKQSKNNSNLHDSI